MTSAHAETIDKDTQEDFTPATVLQRLQEGNQRFVTGNMQRHDYAKQIEHTADKQHPIAVVLSCMDSRNVPEIAFDQGIGHIFTVRVAGNVINKDILGSMEYGTKAVGAKLIVVLGHTNCGAVTAACKDQELGNLTDLLKEIQPAVKTTQEKMPQSDGQSMDFVNAVATQNVHDMVQRIPQQSEIIAELVKQGQLQIVGAMYDVATGKVNFL